MSKRASRLVDSVLALDPLSELPRTGWLLRGVRPCESIADHSFGVALVTMLLVDALRAEGMTIDGEAALRMALVHDAPEACTGDIPMPQKTLELTRAMEALEARLIEQLVPGPPSDDHRRYIERQSLEARLVKAADKIQMMIKVLAYERSSRGDLHEFWENPKNFDALGIGFAEEVFEAIAARGGRRVPRAGSSA
jgi:putative hydrolases of HD superfamily